MYETDELIGRCLNTHSFLTRESLSKERASLLLIKKHLQFVLRICVNDVVSCVHMH